jgi:hypothetical protein
MEKLLNKLIIPHDKVLHALYGLILYSLLGLIAQQVIALIVVIVVAVVKEVYDFYNQEKHTVDVMDAVATALVPIILFFLQWLFTILAI